MLGQLPNGNKALEAEKEFFGVHTKSIKTSETSVKVLD